ncbi:MAG TPA: hypothetical protein VNH83_07420 [Bryobacteraceae bacterium]|nr:hypothetical protein [Bryobacteraceae bacterium]
MGDCAYRFLENEEALSDFLECFERGTWPKPEWNHAAHIAVAGCYLSSYSDEEAADRARRGVRYYNQCTGTINGDHSGYHETLTLFWLAVVKARMRNFRSGTTRIDRVRMLVAEFAPQRDLFREYYTFDVVRSAEARRSWVPPDVKPLP